ncbi:class I SAM-dependent methyltransferase [Thalassotalea sp. PS06]|uniref:class I SAM-dependent methyltransferase n=1 Tax=Thalassotalea sp. PS06 TaxID=2594005 RepID=UPI00116403AA|nr:class I SAM-dependent methyltransferase [Thalassotalea sp. PS06]QDP02076.1 class I SAM-dependent methyltransferase [Thalassotalea sp. PS06]
MNKPFSPHPASFRDPAGFIFIRNDVLYRQINPSGLSDYQGFVDSKLYKELTNRNWLIPHQDVTSDFASADESVVIKPQLIPYVSYPYEWCFSQLKAAALLTLNIQLLSLQHGFSLKDASAYNVQFVDCAPFFIDTLSFAAYSEGHWPAYRQFCQHFLAPLLLIKHTDFRLMSLANNYIDGIPLDLASKLLPRRTWLSLSALMHIHLHANSQSRYADVRAKPLAKVQSMSRQKLIALIENLKNYVETLELGQRQTEWGNYYHNNDYDDGQAQQKGDILKGFCEQMTATLGLAADIGSNSGYYTKIISDKARHVVAFDIDFQAIEYLYRDAKETGNNILPLLLDLTNPSPAIGWGNDERSSFFQRANFDTVVMLAIIHHLVIGNNVPMAKVAESLFQICDQYLVIEFVGKQDSQVKRMLSTREDIFTDYSSESFEKHFTDYFSLRSRVPLDNSQRVMYLFEKPASN